MFVDLLSTFFFLIYTTATYEESCIIFLSRLLRKFSFRLRWKRWKATFFRPAGGKMEIPKVPGGNVEIPKSAGCTISCIHAYPLHNQALKSVSRSKTGFSRFFWKLIKKIYLILLTLQSTITWIVLQSFTFFPKEMLM